MDKNILIFLQEAEADCMEEGAHLASVLSLSEGAMAWVLAHESGFNTTWLGLNDIQVSYQSSSFDWWFSKSTHRQFFDY